MIPQPQAYKACALADIVITTGGTAQGPRDFLHEALSQINAEILVDTVAVRPGHPMLLARTDTCAIFGLPQLCSILLKYANIILF